MARFVKKGPATTYAHALLTLTQAIEDGKLGSRESAEAIAEVATLESMNDDQVTRLTPLNEGIDQIFQNAKLDELIRSAAGMDAKSDPKDFPQYEAAFTAMEMTAAAIGDPKTYMEAFRNPNTAPNKTSVVGSEESFTIESFDNFDFTGFKAQSILTAGLSMASSPFAQGVFKPVVIGAAQSGLDIQVAVPQIYNRTYRKSNGEPFDFRKQSLVKAALDHTILESNSTKIVPVSKTENDPYLAAAADYAPKTVRVGTVDVAIRPIKYGTTVNLLGVSAHDAILKSGEQTEMDTLDPLVGMGVQVLQIKNAAKVGQLEIDISRLPGALMNDVIEGKQTDKYGVFVGSVWVTSTDKMHDGAALSTMDFESKLGLAPGTPWRAKLSLRLTATLDYEKGDIRIDFTEAKFGDVFTGVEFKTRVLPTSTEYADFIAAAELKGLGFFPESQRSNSNMKDLGTVVDVGHVFKFRLAVPMEAPISSVSPINQLGGGVSMDTLSAVKRLRLLGSAATVMLDFEKRLIASQGIENSGVAIGAFLVDPTYIARKIDTQAVVQTMSSSQGLADLQNQIVNAIVMQTNELILKSGYRVALQVFTGSSNNFEVNLVTDPLIENLIMSSGDGRTLGNQRRFTITSVDDLRFRGKIYITVSRTDVSGADPLNAGCHLSAPSLVYKAITTRSGVAAETQLLPREKFHMTCPLMAVLTVEGLETYFHSDLTP